MRLLIACFDDVRRGGGGARRALRVARGLQRRGHETVLLSKAASLPADGPDAEVNGLETVFHTVDPGRLWRIPMLAVVRQLRCKLGRLPRPEAVLAFAPYYIPAARSVWSGVPTIYIFPCLLWRCLKIGGLIERSFWARLNHALLGRLERRALREAVAVVAQSESVREDILDFAPAVRGRIRIVPTGVEDGLAEVRAERGAIRQQYGVGPEHRVLLAAGHLDANKNHSALIDAFGTVGQASLRLWIAGEGPEQPALQRQIDQRGLCGRVRLLGRCSRMPDLYAAADAFVHSAWYDTFPNVVLEAMTCALPVLGPRGEFPRVVSALDGIVEPGRTGWLFHLTDPGSLAGALGDLAATDGATLRAMGQAARGQALKRFDPQTMILRYEKILHQCTGSAWATPRTSDATETTETSG